VPQRVCCGWSDFWRPTNPPSTWETFCCQTCSCSCSCCHCGRPNVRCNVLVTTTRRDGWSILAFMAFVRTTAQTKHCLRKLQNYITALNSGTRIIQYKNLYHEQCLSVSRIGGAVVCAYYCCEAANHQYWWRVVEHSESAKVKCSDISTFHKLNHCHIARSRSHIALTGLGNYWGCSLWHVRPSN